MDSEQGAIGSLPFLIGTSKGTIQLVVSNDVVRRTLRMMTITRPPVLARGGHHVGSDRVQLDIAVTAQEVLRTVDQRGLVASFPQGAGALVRVVEILHVTAAH